jgi:hypothetical protein
MLSYKHIRTHLVPRWRLTPRWELAITAVGLVVIAELTPSLFGVLPGDWFWWIAMRLVWPLMLLVIVLASDVGRIAACLSKSPPKSPAFARRIDVPRGR